MEKSFFNTNKIVIFTYNKLKQNKMNKSELFKTLKEYYSKHGTIKISYEDDHGGKELRETLCETLDLDIKKINDILIRADISYSDMQCSSDPDDNGPSIIKNSKKEINKIFKEALGFKGGFKGIEFGICSGQVDNVLDEMIEATNDYTYTLREALKNGDYSSIDEWKEDLEYYLSEATWLKEIGV